jgi:hypothetical protein
MFIACQAFCHEIREHIVRRIIFDVDRVFFDVVAEEVKLDVYMLGLCMMRGVFRE